MKAIRPLLVGLILIIPLALANAAPSAYRLQVDGLACPFCSYGIEKKLSSIDGVEKIDVDIKSGQVIVTMGEGVDLTEQLAREKIKDAGFTLRSFQKKTGD